MLKIYKNIARIVIVAVVLTTVMSSLAMADGWHGRGRDRKYSRFINGHDGRDGRFDGRGRWDRRYYRRYEDRWDRDRDRYRWDDRYRYNRRYDRRHGWHW
ncbi:MAG: hypothetical protein J2P31_10575 [Blastocatellia bacterium]|nr:hypothetical protein [Blastocatellia bacterium]